jgi:hypothetical protein
MARRFPVLARHEGVWDGEYRRIGADWTELDRHKVRCRVDVPAAGKIAFRLTTRYWWPDGRTQDNVFEAQDGGGELVFDDGRISGWLREIDSETVYMKFAFTGQAGAHVCEAIQISPDGEHRARTWHHFKEHRLSVITMAREVRVSHDPDDFERLPQPPHLPWATPGD